MKKIQTISSKNHALILEQMKKNGMDGEPYKDAKTYKRWLDDGYQVKKGEKSKLSATVWIETKNKKGEEKLIPKKYNLFHRTQVNKIK